MTTNVNATSDAAKAALTFCREYVEVAGDLAGIAKWFLIASLALGVAYAVMEIVKKYQAAPGVRTVAGPGTIKELVEALKGLIEALASAPAWLALFALGIFLFWSAGYAIPDTCQAEANKPYAAAGKDAAAGKKPAGAPTPART